MFKELKVIKLLIFIGLLAVIIFKMDLSGMGITEFYTAKISYTTGDTVKFHVSTKGFTSWTTSSTISGITNSSDYDINLTLNSHKIDYTGVLENGLNLPLFSEFVMPKELKSGIYLINKRYPLIIKSNAKADFTVVYPAMNNLLYTRVNNKAAYDPGTKKTSLLRSGIIDQYSLGFADFIKNTMQEYTINYITDLDLENIDNIKSNTLIIYGKSTYWTPKMKKTLLAFQEKGGNLLNITSYLASNICWHQNENEITLVDESGTHKAWNKVKNFTGSSIYGSGYNKQGYSNNNNYYVRNSLHPILKDIKSDTIKLFANLYASPPVFWRNDSLKIDLDLMSFYKGEIIAFGNGYNNNDSSYVKGIFILQPDPLNGMAVSLGSEDWCLKENIAENEQLNIITKNAIDFLINLTPS